MTWKSNLKHAVRSIFKRPGFSVLVIFFFALAIGANTAIFSVVDGMLQRPLLFEDDEELMLVWDTFRGPDGEVAEYPVSAGNFLRFQAENEVFEDLAATEVINLTLTGGDEPLRIEAAETTAGLFPLLGLEPVAGRLFTAEEDSPGGADVVLVGHSLWGRLFGSNPDLVGQDLELNGRKTRVIGIMPPDMRFPDEVEMWIPRRLDPADLAPWHSLLVVGRLAPGEVVERAHANLATIATRLEEEFPNTHEGWGVSVTPLRARMVGEMRRDLVLLFGAVLFVLAIACANVSSLFLARLAQSSRELAVRSALGGGRRQLLGELLTESLTLSLLGGAGGVILAHFGLGPLLAVSGLEIPTYMSPRIDLRVLGFALLATVVTGVVFGLVPALRVFRANLFPFLREGSRGLLGARSLLMSTLVVAEVALALVLLSGAGLLIQSLYSLQGVETGFDQENLMTARISLPRPRYPEPNHRATFFERAREELAAVPGIQRAAVTTTLPTSKENISGAFTVEGRVPSSQDEQQMANSRMVSPGYFRTLGIPLVRGRDFTSFDNSESPGVVIISQEMARRYFPEENPIGKRVKRGSRESTAPWLEIVGVAGDVRDAGLSEEIGVTWYMPYAQNAWGTVYLVARTESEPETMAQELREAVWAVDRNQPVYDVATMEQVVAESISRPRFKTLLFVLFAGAALLLAAVGIYSVISFATTLRFREFGLRMALGSTRADVWRLVIRHGLGLAAVGLILGVGGALALGRSLSGSLHGVSPYDLPILGLVCIVLLVAALLATVVPAFRATRTHPIIALRRE
jgi:putative ABC transport system permease protein